MARTKRKSGVEKTDAGQVVQEIGKKLVQEQVLFFISAGLSSNWGYPTAGEWVEQILEQCHDILPVDAYREIRRAANPWANKSRKKKKNNPDLGILAELLECRFDKCPTLGCLLGFGLNDQRAREPWLTRAEARERLLRGVEVIGIPHIVLARLAREKLITEVITTNYDVLLETACWAVGMDDEAERADCGGYTGTPAAFRVIAGGFEYYASRTQQNVFRIYKIHGCAHKLITAFANRYAGNEDCDQCPHLTQGNGAMCSRKDAVKDLNLVLTRRELQHWRRDDWAKDLLCDRARNHNLILVGFSGADQVLNVTLRNLFAEIRAALTGEVSAPLDDKAVPNSSRPQRAYAIDIRLGPDLAAILRDASLFEHPPLCPSDQFLPIEDNKDRTRTKLSMESAFRSIYVATIHSLLVALTAERGVGTLRQEASDLTERQAEEILGDVMTFLHWTVEQCPAFLMDTLPGALAASWLYGPNIAESSHRPDMFLLASRPHFYIPFRYHIEATLSLLRFYSLLPSAAFQPDGWAELIKPRGMSALAYMLLPLYRPQPENLPLLNRWIRRRNGVITAGHKIVVVLLRDDDRRRGTRGETEPVETVAAEANYCTVQVSLQDLWTAGSHDIWKEFLLPAVKRQEREEELPYAAAFGR